MNDEVKLILTKLKIVSEEKENGAYICDKEHSKLLLSYIEQLEKENKNLKDNKNEALRYILNYLALDQRYKWNDNVDEKLKLVKNILNGRKKNITNISYEDLLRQNKQLETNYKEANESVIWWQNRYNAIVKQNDDNHKKVVKLENNRDKAIEYLKNLKNYRFEFTFDSVDRHEIVGCEKNFVKDLLNILKGDSDE